MNPLNDPNDEQLIEDYLDDALPLEERRALEERLEIEPELAAQVELQRRIDRSLGQLFPVAQAEQRHVAEVAGSVANSPPTILGFPRRIWWVAAAAVSGVLLAWGISETRRTEPFFEPLPLAQVYTATVNQGFEPYYECDDPQRFAQVFRSRQGQPLKLLDMPAGSRMLGLSYPGGLSRETTAMLCMVDEKPVMVFVDRASADRQIADKVPSETPDLHTFRQLRSGLVFYEVTPFDQPRTLEYLVPF